MVAAMDWSNERYIRLYIRDTLTWKLWTWEARSLFCLLGRKCDRAGIIDIGPHDPVEAAAAIAEVPLDVAGRALPQILKSGTLEACEGTLVFPAFIEAQEAKSTDKHRQRETRARRRSKAMASHGVTPSHVGGHTPSQMVTPSLAKPSQAEPSLISTSQPSVPTRRGTREKPKPPPEALAVAQCLYDAIRSHKPNFKSGHKADRLERELTGWANDIRLAMSEDGVSADRLRAVIDYAHRSKAGEFWRSNIQSGKKLRAKVEDLETRMAAANPSKKLKDANAGFDYVGAGKRIDAFMGAE